MAKSLDDLRLRIAEYSPIVDTPADQYAHNIVSLCLQQIDREHGRAATNQTIDDFALEALGWEKRDIRQCALCGAEIPDDDNVAACGRCIAERQS